MKNAIAPKICIAMIRSELAGYQGYPHTTQGEERFGRALQEVSVSVEHARAVLAKFTQRFPTVQEITDTALNLLPQFEIQHSQLAEWEQEFGKPAPIVFDVSQMSEQQLQADMWVKLKQHFTLKKGGTFPGWAKVSWKEIYEALEEMGHTLNSDQLKMIGRG